LAPLGTTAVTSADANFSRNLHNRELGDALKTRLQVLIHRPSPADDVAVVVNHHAAAVDDAREDLLNSNSRRLKHIDIELQ